MNRRSFLTGVTAFLATPAIIRTPGLLMPVRVVKRWAPLQVSYDVMCQKAVEVPDGFGVDADGRLFRLYTAEERDILETGRWRYINSIIIKGDLPPPHSLTAELARHGFARAHPPVVPKITA